MTTGIKQRFPRGVQMAPPLSTIAEFQAAAAAHPKIVIDASAEWCGPCKQMAPVFEQLAATRPDVAFFTIDVDHAQELATFLCVTSLPTFLFVVDGEVVDTIIGANKTRLQEMVKII